jgi:hypothetical protein
MKLITPETGISVGLISTLLGGVVWLTSLYANSSQTQKDVDDLKVRVEKKIEADVLFKERVLEDLSWIKERLKK